MMGNLFDRIECKKCPSIYVSVYFRKSLKISFTKMIVFFCFSFVTAAAGDINDNDNDDNGNDL
jgi:hypothetical protein